MWEVSGKSSGKLATCSELSLESVTLFGASCDVGRLDDTGFDQAIEMIDNGRP